MLKKQITENNPKFKKKIVPDPEKMIFKIPQEICHYLLNFPVSTPVLF
jgi:hypothetical protein